MAGSGLHAPYLGGTWPLQLLPPLFQRLLHHTHPREPSSYRASHCVCPGWHDAAHDKFAPLAAFCLAQGPSLGYSGPCRYVTGAPGPGASSSLPCTVSCCLHQSPVLANEPERQRFTPTLHRVRGSECLEPLRFGKCRAERKKRAVEPDTVTEPRQVRVRQRDGDCRRLAQPAVEYNGSARLKERSWVVWLPPNFPAQGIQALCKRSWSVI